MLAAHCFSTAIADAGYEHAVSGDFEVVLPGDRSADEFEFIAMELDQFVADLAVQVVVAGVAVGMFVDAAPGEHHFSDQPGLGQFGERAVDGGPADLAAGYGFAQMGHEFIGVKVVVVAENLLDDDAALLRNPFSTRFEELRKTLQRRL